MQTTNNRSTIILRFASSTTPHLCSADERYRCLSHQAILFVVIQIVCVLMVRRQLQWLFCLSLYSYIYCYKLFYFEHIKENKQQYSHFASALNNSIKGKQHFTPPQQSIYFQKLKSKFNFFSKM